MGLMSKLVKGAMAKKAFDFVSSEAKKPKNKAKFRDLKNRLTRR